ncbi:GSCFA family protein [Xylanibacter ruminicola]|uniref:GSCFA family protein n=1 Tax=Xylanibacter ruminicola TaxID=839 RepID=A0A1M7LFC0_XYLRU|nr:GSCFA domain-containing protein [Xylanibacter ruminicola]SFC29218.1 GSCFA family protein [Xylanibacter ruminicola]SHM76109.1 GSCFA family protein [Xylanibacter ruminicola]
MEFRTIVDIDDPGFRIGACEEMLFVGSCFADKIGARFTDEKFRTIVNPFGVMYNPASILHTIQRLSAQPDLKSVKTAFLTLGTNHVYILNETGEIVDNCQKRPQSLFTEKELTVDECADYLQQGIDILHAANPDMRIVLTVSPIRYRKYGYHGSQLSKATLLLAVNKVIKMFRSALPLGSSKNVQCSAPALLACKARMFNVHYFPAYEIINDELRDYRFYADDMLHPSSQAVEYIWQRFSEVYLSPEAKAFLKEWQPLKAALNHKPFNPDSDEYRIFMDKTMLKISELQKKYPNFAV